MRYIRLRHDLAVMVADELAVDFISLSAAADHQASGLSSRSITVFLFAAKRMRPTVGPIRVSIVCPDWPSASG